MHKLGNYSDTKAIKTIVSFNRMIFIIAYLVYLSGRNCSIRIVSMVLRLALLFPSRYSYLKDLFCLSTPLVVFTEHKRRSFLNAHTHR